MTENNDLKNIFENRSGLGVLSTADRDGVVDAAIYSRPHVVDDGTVVFIMRERLTYSNLKENPHAAFLFVEDGPSYQGVRLFLKKTREDQDEEKIRQMTRRHLSPEEDARKGPKHLVYFSVEKVLPLVGSGD